MPCLKLLRIFNYTLPYGIYTKSIFLFDFVVAKVASFDQSLPFVALQLL